MSDDHAERRELDARLHAKVVSALAALTFTLILAGWMFGAVTGTEALTMLKWWAPPWIIMCGWSLRNVRRWSR